MRFEGARRIYAQDGTTFFVCDQFAGSPKLSDEHEEFIWVSLKMFLIITSALNTKQQ